MVNLQGTTGLETAACRAADSRPVALTWPTSFSARSSAASTRVRLWALRGRHAYPEVFIWITDGRFSDGIVVRRLTPEAFFGGPIALVKDGDPITIEPEMWTITLQISAEQFEARPKVWEPMKPGYTRGVLAK